MRAMTPLSLKEATGLLQMVSQNRGRLGEMFVRIAPEIARAGNLIELGLAEGAVSTFERVIRGDMPHERDIRRSLALLAAGIGLREMKEAARSMTGVREAIDDLFYLKDFSREPRKPAFLATMEDPRRGFSPIATENGTEIAFYQKPTDLKEPWKNLPEERWAKGVGLIVFRNQGSDTYGMVFIHSLGKVEWSKIRKGAWQSAGETTLFSHHRLTFEEALKMVVANGVANGRKWRAVDELLLRAKHRTPTGLGGSSSLLFHGHGELNAKKALLVYAEVLELLGAVLTGSLEGIEPRWFDFLADKAKRNTFGNPKSLYMGRSSTEMVVGGLLKTIQGIQGGLFEGERLPILAEGYSGVGRLLLERLREGRIPIAGIIDGDIKNLVKARGAKIKEPLFFVRSKWEPTISVASTLKRRGIQRKKSLGEILEALSDVAIFSPNNGSFPIDFEAATALILGGVHAVAGAAKNHFGLDLSGSPEPVARILQTADIFAPADFVIDSLRGIAGIFDAVGVPDFMARNGTFPNLIEETVQEDYSTFRQGDSPYLVRWERARLDSLV